MRVAWPLLLENPMRITFISLCVLAAAAAGCSDDGGTLPADTDEGSGSGSGGGTTVPMTTMTTAPGDGGSATGSGDEGSATTTATTDADTTGGDAGSSTGDGSATDDSTGGTPAAGVCVAACEADADCCPLGSIGCPGKDYPNNWTCDEGACSSGGCSEDADCESLVPLTNDECHPIGGVGTCFEPCKDDGDCMGDTECIGEADDGTMYCSAPVDPCKSDDDCDGAGICDTDAGTCGCTMDDECTADGLGACSSPG